MRRDRVLCRFPSLHSVDIDLLNFPPRGPIERECKWRTSAEHKALNGYSFRRASSRGRLANHDTRAVPGLLRDRGWRA